MNPSDIISPFTFGTPVIGPNYFGRKSQKDQFFSILKSSNLQPIRVYGFRRSGKTSFLRSLVGKYPDLSCKDYSTIIVYVNLLKLPKRTIKDFCSLIAKSIQKTMALEVESTNDINSIDTLSSWLDKLFNNERKVRCVVLLDEFDILTDPLNTEYDATFFGNMRAICCDELLCHFAWVTCSVCELNQPSPQEREFDKSSDFFNIFHVNPIILGGFSEKEAFTLIDELSRKNGVTFSRDEITEICNISGLMPYFIQIIADAWFRKKRKNKSVKELLDSHINELIYKGSMIDHLFWDYWKILNFSEQKFLLEIFGCKLDAEEYHAVRLKLIDYGLLKSEGRSTNFNGSLFKKWIEFHELYRKPIEGVATDLKQINQFVSEIKSSQEEIKSLEVRKAAIKTASAKLDKNTHINEIENYRQQIVEIDDAISEWKNQIYSIRNSMVSYILEENQQINLLSTFGNQIDTLSTEKIDRLFHQVVTLRNDLERKSVPIPTELDNNSKGSAISDNDKRAKIKMSLSLLGPKVEIEKTITDPNVSDVWRVFWKGVKSIFQQQDP